MWKLVALYGTVVFVACLVALLCYTSVKGLAIEWKPMLASSTVVAAITTIFFHRRLRKHRRNWSRDHAKFVHSLQSLIDKMARLSFVDLSIFISALSRVSEDEVFFMTVRGTANDEVLAHMVSLGLTEECYGQQLGPALDWSVTYKLLPKGRERLDFILDAVAKQRKMRRGQPFAA